MKLFKLIFGVALFALLVVLVQLVDAPKRSAAVEFQTLPDSNIKILAEREFAEGRTDAGLLMLDYILENDLPGKADATNLRDTVLSQLAAKSGVERLTGSGWANRTADSSFGSLGGATVADSVAFGEIADFVRQGAFEENQDEFIVAANNARGLATIFPPAENTLTLVKAARRAGALNEMLANHLRRLLGAIQRDPKSATALDEFRQSFMPVFELAKKCRTWAEFTAILRQADSPEQIKLLTKIISTPPATSRRIAQILVIASTAGRPAVAACVDQILRQGPRTVDALYAAAAKGPGGLRFVVEHPGLNPQITRVVVKTRPSLLGNLQEMYQALASKHGAALPALKYVLIAIVTGMLVLLVVPGRYLEKLLASGKVPEPGPSHFLLSALAVGAVLSGLAYLLSVAMRASSVETTTALGGAGTEAGTALAGVRPDSALLSGTVVLLSLTIHAIVWFYVRSKIREVEDDEAADPALRLKRLENLEVFLDLPLFTGLGLTVIAFILITLDAGMSRHFAYTSTVVGILSAVSLRIRYLYPLKDRLIQAR
jgi:hypothetical protein